MVELIILNGLLLLEVISLYLCPIHISPQSESVTLVKDKKTKAVV